MSSHKTDGSGKPCEYGHEHLPHAVVIQLQDERSVCLLLVPILNLPDSPLRKQDDAYRVCLYIFILVLTFLSLLITPLSSPLCDVARQGGEGEIMCLLFFLLKYLVGHHLPPS